jgi:hypothetical protein
MTETETSFIVAFVIPEELIVRKSMSRRVTLDSLTWIAGKDRRCVDDLIANVARFFL